jgi:hypothetical protein
LLGVAFALFSKGDIPATIQGKQTLISKGAFIGYSLLGYTIIFVPIWLVVRLIVNRNDKKEAERERERESGS